MATKKFIQKVQCPHCTRWHTTQTAFDRWIGGHPCLDAQKEGFVCYDNDYIMHRYMVGNSREVQALMIVEVKTHDKKPDAAQRDTLNLLGQFLRNRKPTNHKKNYIQTENAPNIAFSVMNKRYILVRAFGYHLLTFENNDPEDSQWIKWDNKYIDKTTLVKLLKFELDPDTLQPMDLRKHHRKEDLLFEAI